MPQSIRALLLVGALLGSVLSVGGVSAAAQPAGPAPLHAVERPLAGQYIVVFKEGADPRSVAAVAGISPKHVYSAALRGFAAALNAGQLTALQHNAHVAYIEPDQSVTIEATTQPGATWGLDRVDQRSLPLSSTYSYTSTGAGVTAYVIDTGIRFAHAEFGGRATSGYDAVDGGPADDCHGHGTHVAGTVGGSSYGVAKTVSLVAVRVLDCSGSGATSGVIAGMDWVTRNHASPAVANLSLGGGASTAVDEATSRMIASGVTTAVAAGNGNRGGRAQDACNYSPARVPEAITVAATDRTDTKTSWSNYGACVDWFAPGSQITSAWYTGNTATNTISGTSMATPHAAGVAALYLAANGGATPQQVRDALFAATTKGIVGNANTANNHLLFTNY